MSVKKLILWIIVALFVVVAVINVSKSVLFCYTSLWRYSADYQGFAGDFELVKNYVDTQFPNESDKWLSVAYDGAGGIGLFDPETKSNMDLPEDIVSALRRISTGAFYYKDSNLDTIRIQRDRISFCIVNGEYALVYSPDQKLTYVNSPNEDAKVKVRSIGDGWYHVTKFRF